VYIDTSYDDLSLDTSKLNASNSARAIIMQHSFGMESDMKKARTFATTHTLLLIEDSAHQLGLIARDHNTPLADISVHSFGVEKLLPTKFGGAVWVNPDMENTPLRDALRESLSNLPVVTAAVAGRAKRYRGINRLLNHTPSFLEPGLRSVVTKLGLFESAIMPDEVAGKNHDAPAQPSAFMLQEMADALEHYEQILKKRREAAEVYLDAMPSEFTVPKGMGKSAAPVRFPVLCKDKATAQHLFDALRAEGHYSGKWYRPILFPGTLNPAPYNYDSESYPAAEDISARILNLPTNISVNEAVEIVDVLRRQTNRQ
jgi:dTDP-4-amino-4,6-dideoxygalactose transaminase